jgi:APA family basic amino acid/polyamine antiporter
MTTTPETGTAVASEPELSRAIALPHATAMVVGTIIGASIFVQPSEITGRVPSVSGIFLVWAVSGVLTLFGALVCAELTTVFPKSGGVYVFLRESFGRPLGFLWGWAMFWTMHSGIIAAIAVVFARYVGFFVPLGDGALRAVAITAILLLSFVNVLGVKHGSVLQTLFTAGKLLAIVLIVAVGFALGGSVPDAALRPDAPPGQPWGLGDFALALVAGLFAFGGWHMVTYSAGETVDPRRTIPRALAIGVAVVTLCYIALNAVYLYVLPLDTVAASTRIAADAAERVLGPGAGAAVSGLVIFSTFGALAGIVLAGPRVYYAMAKDGLLFRWMGSVHPVRRTPVLAIALQAFWSSVLVATGTYGELFRRVVYTEWIFFGLLAVGLFLLRRRGAERTYSIWGYPFVPAIFALGAFAIALNQIAAEPRDSMIGLGLVVIGLPVYWIWTRFRTSNP